MNKWWTPLAFAWPYVQRYRGRLFAGILFGLLFGLTNAGALAVTKIMLDRLSPPAPVTATATAPMGVAAAAQTSLTHGLENWLPQVGAKPTWQQMLGGLFILPFIVALRGVTSYLSSYCISWVGEHVSNDLRCDVLAKLNSLSLDYFDRSRLGDLVTRVQGDTAALHGCLDRGFSDSIKEPFTIAAVAGYLFMLDWKLSLIVLVFVPIYIAPIQILGRKARKAGWAGIDKAISLSSLLIEQLSGIRIVKAFGLEARQGERFAVLSGQILRFNMKKWQSRGLVNPILESISMLGAGAVIVYAISSGTSIAVLGTFIPAAVLFFASARKLGGLHVIFKEASVGVDRLQQLFATPPSVHERVDGVALAPIQSNIHFDGVKFRYGEAEVLRGLDLTVKRGARIGIAGESGCGKSTLLNLLFRFYDPTGGAIRIDGKDLREVRMADLRYQLALVSQEVVLFDLSVADNIGCGKKGATREEIETAAKAANAHEFIMEMPEGYDTMIGERGVRLSGGQRQRLAIARAFVRNAPILVLDEATAALDAQAEEVVQRAIDRLTENRTVICVAHRLVTLRGMDEIIVLSRGEIVERGSFAELMRLDKYFASMARRQGMQGEDHAKSV